MKRYNKFIKSIIFIFLGLGIGILITQYKPLTSLIGNIRVQSNPPKIWFDETDAKKASLANFYHKIVLSEEKMDWYSDYDLSPQSIKNNLTRDQYITYKTNWIKQNKIVSLKFVVNDIQVVSDNGTIDRTMIVCLTTECVDKDKIEFNAKRKYVYINGDWQIFDPEPSNRALAASSFSYNNESPTDQKTFVANWSLGSNSATFAIREYALSLDEDPSALANEEASIEKYKTDQANKPKVIYQQTPVYVPQPIYQPAPVVQQNAYPTHCTSQTVGSSTYTNCY